MIAAYSSENKNLSTTNCYTLFPYLRAWNLTLLCIFSQSRRYHTVSFQNLYATLRSHFQQHAYFPYHIAKLLWKFLSNWTKFTKLKRSKGWYFLRLSIKRNAFIQNYFNKWKILFNFWLGKCFLFYFFILPNITNILTGLCTVRAFTWVNSTFSCFTFCDRKIYIMYTSQTTLYNIYMFNCVFNFTNK